MIWCEFYVIFGVLGLILSCLSISAQVVVSVVTNAPTSLESPYMTNMQDMTSSVCDHTTEGYEKQLIDTRDGNKYWVGKMKDGRCWMLQNLALGSATSTTGKTSLTPSDSNITNDWTLPKAYTSAKSGTTDNTGTAVWNFGEWVLATPLLAEGCYSANNDPSTCIKVGFVDVSDSTKFEPTYIAKTGNWNGANATNNTLVAVNCTSWSGSGTSRTCTAGTYDAHYLIGNYYQWNAAVAGTGGSITDQDASGSICPKGWKLPTNGTSIGSYGGLLSKYGISSSISGTVSGKSYNIAGSPLSFVRSGRVDPGSSVSFAGRNGYYWSSRAYSSNNNAYYMGFNGSFDPSTYSSRYSGQAVRCIAE